MERSCSKMITRASSVRHLGNSKKCEKGRKSEDPRSAMLGQQKLARPDSKMNLGKKSKEYGQRDQLFSALQEHCPLARTDSKMNFGKKTSQDRKSGDALSAVKAHHQLARANSRMNFGKKTSQDRKSGDALSAVKEHHQLARANSKMNFGKKLKNRKSADELARAGSETNFRRKSKGDDAAKSPKTCGLLEKSDNLTTCASRKSSEDGKSSEEALSTNRPDLVRERLSPTVVNQQSQDSDRGELTTGGEDEIEGLKRENKRLRKVLRDTKKSATGRALGDENRNLQNQLQQLQRVIDSEPSLECMFQELEETKIGFSLLKVEKAKIDKKLAKARRAARKK